MVILDAAPVAEERPADTPAERAPLAEIEHLIADGQVEAARTRLEQLEGAGPFDSQVQFLLALLDIRAKQFREAEQRLRRILVREPGAARVRLELGRALFLDGKYVASERQFRLARAGQLPEPVQLNVDRYLAAIRQKKRFNVELAFALAPDSNVNASPASDAVTIYGLPFQLSDDARASSGIGATADGSIEWAPQLSPRTGLRIGGQGHRTQYRKSQFNDSTLTAYAGVRLNRTKWTHDLTGIVAERWYGERPYSRSIGATVATSYAVDRKTELNGSVAIYSIKYPNFTDQDGVLTGISLGAARAVSPRSVLRATVGVNWQKARVEPLANHRQTLALEWFREFSGGITLVLSPSLTRIGYAAPLPAFGTTRIDWQATAQVRLQSRRIDVRGFTPRLGYIFTHNASTVPLYRFTRNRFELGVVRSF